MNFYKLSAMAISPKYATSGSGCFDLSACLPAEVEVSGYTKMNTKFSRKLTQGANTLQIFPGERVLVPTGLIFDIPEGYMMNIMPRSSTGYKLGLTLPNNVGKIDSDYIEETFLLLMNVSSSIVEIKHGDRLCQAELQRVVKAELEEIFDRPKQKSERNGGLGSTGTN